MVDTGDARIRLHIADAIATITIMRAEKYNALDFQMIGALERAAHAIDADTTIRAAIITGDGDKSFCAGGDIAAWSELSPEQFSLQWIRQGHRAFDALARLRQPLVAALNGHCLGGGLELAVAADLRIAGTHIKLGQPETGLGVIAGWSGTQRAVRRFGAQTVRRMAIFGETFSAEQGLALGIVDQVVPKGEELRTAHAVLAKLMDRAPFATAATKMLVNAADGEDQERTLEVLGSMAAASHAELKEGVAAFREKRKPRF
jgi:enoyl-CoA hydratase/carnithine racemase